MAVLDTAIHLDAGFRGWRRRRDVGARVKAGHDDLVYQKILLFPDEP